MSKSPSSFNSSALVFAGLDPTGGAGISADIETFSNLNVHALPIITCLTVQDTRNVKHLQSVDIQLLQQQLETLLQDISFQVIKLGLLSSIEIIDLVANTIKSQSNIPVIFDPILKAGGGANLSNTTVDTIIKSMRENIIPHTTLMTPNSLEARLLTGKEELNDCAKELSNLGCQHILITGEHENDPEQITNTLYTSDNKGCLTHTTYQWPRLPHQYHGSGCTLASAISAYIASSLTINDAVQQAQQFTHSSLQQAIQLGQGQYHPNRFIDN